jgi:hypothetical protein
MLRFNKKRLIIFLIYISFFIAIPIIKNESRLIEKKIKNYNNQIEILEKNFSEAYLEFQYLSSPEILEKNISKNIDTNYNNLDTSQIYLSFNEFINEKKKISKILLDEKQEK